MNLGVLNLDRIWSGMIKIIIECYVFNRLYSFIFSIMYSIIPTADCIYSS